METHDPRRAFDALASEHGIPILRFLRDRDWTLASQVAQGLNIHTSTASKHLAAFHEAGLVERKEHAAKRPTYAYRLPSPIVRIEIDLEDRGRAPPELASAVEAFVQELLKAASRLGGARLEGQFVKALFGREDWRPVLKKRLARAPRAAFESLVRDARTTCTGVLGAATAERLIRLAIQAAADGHHDELSQLLPEVKA